MIIIFNVFLICHIVGGSIGLLAGVLNMLRKKGDKAHKLVGKIFLISMLTTGISSLIVASIHPNHFLFMVGVFTLYMVGSGQLYLKLRENPTYKSIEWAITTIMFIAVILFIGFGALTLMQKNLFGLVHVTFGFLGLLFVRKDFQNFKGKSAIKNYWFVAHIQRMTGGFIAAFTAFLVVNAKYFPEQFPHFVIWLLPTILVTPVIIKWSRKYEIKNN